MGVSLWNESQNHIIIGNANSQVKWWKISFSSSPVILWNDQNREMERNEINI